MAENIVVKTLTCRREKSKKGMTCYLDGTQGQTIIENVNHVINERACVDTHQTKDGVVYNLTYKSPNVFAKIDDEKKMGKNVKSITLKPFTKLE